MTISNTPRQRGGVPLGASELDSRNPLLLAWRQSRVALVARDENEAVDAAERSCYRSLTAQTPTLGSRCLSKRWPAKPRRDFATAEARYRELTSLAHPDDAGAADGARRRSSTGGRETQEAVDRLPVQALDGLDRAFLPRRRRRTVPPVQPPSGEAARARERCRSAALHQVSGPRLPGGWTGPGAASAWADTLRTGSPAQAAGSPGTAQRRGVALKILETVGAELPAIPRAYLLSSRLVAGAQRATRRRRRRLARQALGVRTRRAGNLVPQEPLVLMNLGVTHGRARQPRPAPSDYYRAKLPAVPGARRRRREPQRNPGESRSVAHRLRSESRGRTP